MKFENILQTLTTPHIEVTLRMSFSMLLSYIFLFADIRYITPINTTQLLSILVPFLTMLFPTLMFTFGSLLLPTLSIFLYAFISSTMLLAIAVGGGTAAYIVSFGVWSFWNCWLRWEKSEGNKVSIILIAVIFQTLLIWPTFLTVQQGFVVPDPYFSNDTNEALESYLTETVDVAQSMGVGSHDLTVADGVLQGVSVVVTVNDDETTSTFVEGGMWLVKGMWTFSGVNNPIAVYQNMLIMTSWLVVICGLAVLSPPFRTIRSAVWRGMIPGALKEAAGMLRLHVNLLDAQSSRDLEASKHNADSSGENDGEVGNEELDEAEDVIAEIGTKVMQARGKSIFHMNMLFDGSLAKYTFFEPRLLDCKPVECTGAYLADLSHQVGRIVSASVGFSLFARDFSSEMKQHYQSTASNLEVCAKALATGNASFLDDVDLDTEGSYHDVFTMSERMDQIAQISRKWLNAMAGTSESNESFKSFKMNLTPWVMAHFRHYCFLIQYLSAPFKKETWTSIFDKDSYGLVKLVWCLKYSIGLSLLIVISVYWPAYSRGFAIGREDDPMKEAYSLANGGWVLVAYCFATTQTAEGSIKKGLLRMCGTLAGALSGWLTLLACEDGRFNYNYNPYGLVAWLAVTSSAATWSATGRGFTARISLNNSFGYGPIYFVITQVIVVGYVATIYGPESRDWITVNRLVANLVGIAMAMVLAVIPPGNYGGDPGHTHKINRFHWHVVLSTLQTLVSSEIINSPEEVSSASARFQKMASYAFRSAADMQGLASDFQKDAERLQEKPFKLPCFRVDPRVKAEIGKITRDIYVASFIPKLVAKIIESDDDRALLLGKDGDVQRELQKILDAMTTSGISGFKETASQEFNSKNDTTMLIHTIHWLIAEMVQHEDALNQIKWGF